jgi:tetratricopeptide (TPR) repeat protein
MDTYPEAALTAADVDDRRGAARWFLQRGRELTLADRLEDARRCYQRSLELFPTAGAHAGLARVHEQLGQWAEAQTAYVRALRLAPTLPTARQGLTRLLALSN